MPMPLSDANDTGDFEVEPELAEEGAGDPVYPDCIPDRPSVPVPNLWPEEEDADAIDWSQVFVDMSHTLYIAGQH